MFAQLLQNLGSYLDFSKRLATTVPGLVMALALVLMTASAPEWAQQPFACSSVQSLVSEWNEAERKLEKPGAEGYLDRLMRAKESALRRAYYGAVNGAEALPARAEEANAAFQALQAFYDGEGKVLVEQRKSLKGEAKAAEESLADVDRKLSESRYGSLCGRHFEWSAIGSDLLMFGVLGFILGVVFDPVNKAIFLQKLPELVASKEIPKPDGKRGQERKAQKIAALARVFVPKEHAENRNPGRLREHSPQFYIGKGVIAAGEYQDLIDRFYRFCEVTTGLVMPIALIGVALAQHYRSQDRWAQAIATLVLSFCASMLLARIGVRRYAEFRAAVAELIDGRIDQLDEAKQKSAESKVDILQLQMLVHQADQIMSSWFRRGDRGSE
jgi:hypothetical protein